MAKPKTPKSAAPRFGIGEWYGHQFAKLTPVERQKFSKIAQGPVKQNPPCPFMAGSRYCPKKGGICSLRLYKDTGSGSGAVVTGHLGALRVMCPHRFKQSGTIFKMIGEELLGTSEPLIVPEVRFLIRDRLLGIGDTEAAGGDTEEDSRSEDVGNIDHVLVHPNTTQLRWCALEIQAVYFSGREMRSLFQDIGTYSGRGIPFPDRARRPDYRSSGPKRLMPQLQIKVPTLRRWGKKMAVVVDTTWFDTNVVNVPTVGDISNCDIAWFLIEFDESTEPATLRVTGPKLQTLERAVEGLTGGHPVTLSEFEDKIRDKLKPKKSKKGSSNVAPNPDFDQ